MLRIRRLNNKHFYMIAILLCFVECISYSLFQTFNNSLFYITAILVFVDFLTIRYIKIGDLPFLLLIVLFFIIDNIYLTGSYVLGLKYAIIFIAAYMFERIAFDHSFWQLGIFAGIVYIIRYAFSSKVYTEEFQNQISMYGNIKNVQVLNINIPCFFVFICLVFSVLYCKAYKIKYEKKIALICTLISSLFSWKFNCRVTILTSLLTYIMMEWVPLEFWKNRKRTNIIVISLFLLSCLYPLIVVVYFYKPGSLSTEMLFTGRETIWSNFYYYISSNSKTFLLGLGSDYRLRVSGGLTMHNSLLEWAFNFGFIGVALYVIYSIRIINRAFDDKITDMQALMIVSYVIMLIFALVNTAIQREYLFVFFSLFLGLSNNSTLKERESAMKSQT